MKYYCRKCHNQFKDRGNEWTIQEVEACDTCYDFNKGESKI